MKSKAHLPLIELSVMLLVLFLAAALCLRAFVHADRISAESLRRDRALTLAQNSVEVLKSCAGDYAAAAELLGAAEEDGQLYLHYDQNWEPLSGEGPYVLVIRPTEDDLAGFGRAKVQLFADGQPLVSLSAAWQEVDAHG